MSSRSVGQHHGDLRAVVIEAAIGALENDDDVELSMRALARTIGVSPGAMYYHFADRASLLDAVAHDGFVRLGQIQAGVESHRVDDQLEDLITAYMHFAADHPSLYKVMFTAVTDPPATASRETTDAASATFDRLANVVAKTNDTLAHDEARKRALMIWTLTHGAVELAHWSTQLDPAFTLAQVIEETAQSAFAIAANTRQP